MKSYVATRLRRFRSRPQLEAWQDARARKHIGWVIRRSAYYRRLYAGLPIDSWRSFPTIDKQSMMDAFDELNTVGLHKDEASVLARRAEETRDFRPVIGDLTVGLSSGTSGSPGLFVVSPKERWDYAGTILARVLPHPIWAHQRIALFLRANSNLYTSIRTSRIAFHYFDLMRPVNEHVLRLREVAPTVLIAPPSVLRFLADHHSAFPRPEKIISVAEVLDPLDEIHIREVFGQKVHQIYQATEGLLGVTCEEGRLHLCEDRVVIQRERIGIGGRFSPIVTDFFRRTQPIIRYRLDDLLHEDPAPCSCGSAFAVIRRIEGRAGDVLELAGMNGTMVPVFPDLIARAVLLASEHIKDYEVLQPERGRLLVSFSSSNANRSGIEAAVRQKLTQMAVQLGANPPAVEITEALGSARGEKRRRVRRLR